MPRGATPRRNLGKKIVTRLLASTMAAGMSAPTVSTRLPNWETNRTLDTDAAT
jgi:hypothetical protein